jgi:hypothetical protein
MLLWLHDAADRNKLATGTRPAGPESQSGALFSVRILPPVFCSDRQGCCGYASRIDAPIVNLNFHFLDRRAGVDLGLTSSYSRAG